MNTMNGQWLQKCYRICAVAFIVPLLSILLGCFAPHTGYIGMVSYHPDDDPETALYEDFLYKHRSPMVRYPAKTAYDTGAVIALPIGITSLCIGCMITDSREERTLFFGLPGMLSSSLMGSAIGYPCWTLFGWWWPEQKVTKPASSDEDKPKQSTTGN